MSKAKYFTKEGLKKKKEELDYLVKVKRPDISRQIGEAIDKGDLSENAEYDAAKDAQGHLEAKIAHLQNDLAYVKIVDEKNIDTSKVSMMSKVTIKNIKTKAKMTYAIVPESDADMSLNKISISSPVAKALLGNVIGDIVEVTVPAGVISFEIIEITV